MSMEKNRLFLQLKVSMDKFIKSVKHAMMK